MKTRFLIGLVCGLAVATTMSLVAQDQRGPGFAKVGLVNLTRVLREYDKSKVGQKEVNDLRLALQREINEKNKEGRDLKNKAELYTEGSKKRRDLERKMATLKGEIQAIAEQGNKDINLKLAAMMKGCSDDVQSVSAQLAKAQGFTLILRFNEGSIQGKSWKTTLAQVSQRRVLYHRPEMDVTGEIITRLNAAEASKQKAGQ